MNNPLVSVICLCYNQEQFVREAIASVAGQSYANIELIVVDDASTDGSVHAIREAIQHNPAIRLLALAKNEGNCKAFNKGLQLSKGDFIIDLAADDVLMPERIEKGVRALQQAGSPYGVNFTDAYWIGAGGGIISKHSDRFPHRSIPQGDIYRHLIERFFICSPTVMFTRAVIVALHGYDESLAYEDFDFWIRSSRQFYYCYTPEVLMKKRVLKKSMSARQFRWFSPQQYTTHRVCEKIMALNATPEEQAALGRRILYEIYVSLRLLMLPLAWKYAMLWIKNRMRKYE